MPGSIQKREKGTYLLRVTYGKDYTGKAKRFHKTVKCSSKAQA